MKKVLFILVIVITVVILVWLANIRIGKLIDTIQLVGNKAILEEDIARVIKEEVRGDYPKAQQQIIETTLQILNLTDWLNYSPLNSSITFGDIHPNNGEEMIVTISNDADLGLVAVYTKGSSGYEIISSLTELVPITSLNLLDLPGLPHKAIVLDQYLNEMTGAFFEVKTKSIYIFIGPTLTEIWARDSFLRELQPLPEENNQWLMEIEEADIFLHENKIEVNGERTKWKSTAGLNSNYELVDATTIKELHRWNQQTSSFERIY